MQFEVHSGETVPDAILLSAMRANFLYSSDGTGSEAEAPRSEFRLVEHCITDPLRPSEREIRVTQLH